MKRVVFTAHARQRIAEMDLTEAEVEQVVLRPKLTYAGPRRHGENTVYCGFNDIAVAVVPDKKGDPNCLVVATVLWNHREFTRPVPACSINYLHHQLFHD